MSEITEAAKVSMSRNEFDAVLAAKDAEIERLIGSNRRMCEAIAAVHNTDSREMRINASMSWAYAKDDAAAAIISQQLRSAADTVEKREIDHATVTQDRDTLAAQVAELRRDAERLSDERDSAKSRVRELERMLGSDPVSGGNLRLKSRSQTFGRYTGVTKESNDLA